MYKRHYLVWSRRRTGSEPWALEGSFNSKAKAIRFCKHTRENFKLYMKQEIYFKVCFIDEEDKMRTVREIS